MEAEVLSVARSPLEHLNQGPGEVAEHIDTIQDNRLEHLVDVVLVVVDPVVIKVLQISITIRLSQ